MDKPILLCLAIAERVYTEVEVIELYELDLRRKNLDVRFERVPEKEIVETAKLRKPALILAGYRGFSSDPSLMGTPLDAVFKVLKSDPGTRDIPILMVEAIQDIDRRAQECGVDAYLKLPFKPGMFYDAVSRLIGTWVTAECAEEETKLDAC